MPETTWFLSPCIDLRPAEDFQQAHIKNTTSLPASRLASAMHELPDKDQVLQLIGTQHQLAECRAFLLDKGYTISREIEATESLWQWAEQQDLLEAGCHSVPLWQANPLLQGAIEEIEQATRGRSAIDLACGAGRDTVYLAQRGWQVTGVDIKADALARCQALAESAQVDVDTLQADIEARPEVLGDHTYDLIIVMRFLYRPLLKRLVKHLKPGGVLCYSTFMVGSEQFGSPRNPNYLLKPGELAEVYADLTIIKDEVHHLADGRPVALFVAQHP
jgi:SAM-dependent methyltransferase